MTKELRPVHHDISCDVCGRTILKGERPEPYLAPGGQRKVVCELCAGRADATGWIRESAHGELPSTYSRPEQGSPIGRWWRRVTGGGMAPTASSNGAEPAAEGYEPGYEEEEPVEVEPPPVERHPVAPPVERHAAVPPVAHRTDARHVRAVPTNAQVKVERALEIFNATEHPRTIAGIARSLGEPWVCAVPLPDAPSEVAVVVAWELSWYRYRVDLGDADSPVSLVDKGYEVDEIDEELRDWNGSATEAGQLGVGVRS